MRFKPAALTALFAALALSALSIPSAARAGVVLGNLGPLEDATLTTPGFGLGDDQEFAFGFSPGGSSLAWELTKVVFGLRGDVGSTPVNYTASLFSDSSGAPGSLIQVIGTGSGNNNLTKVAFTPLTPIPLTSIPATTYWVVLNADAGYTWIRPNSAPVEQNSSGWVVAGGTNPVWRTGSGAWESVGGNFSVSLSAVPEPSTYALAGMGLAAAGFARRLRKARRVTG
jgi:hypothetical protein